MYATRHKKTKKWVTGTDFRYNPPRQITDGVTPLLIAYDFQVKTELLFRKVNSNYAYVDVNGGTIRVTLHKDWVNNSAYVTSNSCFKRKR